jgi:hypothetical protein
MQGERAAGMPGSKAAPGLDPEASAEAQDRLIREIVKCRRKKRRGVGPGHSVPKEHPDLAGRPAHRNGVRISDLGVSRKDRGTGGASTR